MSDHQWVLYCLGAAFYAVIMLSMFYANRTELDDLEGDRYLYDDQNEYRRKRKMLEKDAKWIAVLILLVVIWPIPLAFLLMVALYTVVRLIVSTALGRG